MKILSPYCIQFPTVREDRMSRLRNQLSTELAVASEIIPTIQNDWNTADDNRRSPISEIELIENSIPGIFSSLEVGSFLEIVRSRLNAILICWDVETHRDRQMGWTWLTYLSESNQTGKFYMWSDDTNIEGAELVLPVRYGTSFCFDHTKPHGFNIDMQEKSWVPFLSLIVTKNSVQETLDTVKTLRIPKWRKSNERNS